MSLVLTIEQECALDGSAAEGETGQIVLMPREGVAGAVDEKELVQVGKTESPARKDEMDLADTLVVKTN